MLDRNKKINLAIIPARGGSTRIPNKNIKHFHGKPIISYTIETLKKSNCFDEILVSTDSDKIKSISEEYGASVPFMRNQKLSDSFTPTVPVIKDAIKQFEDIYNANVDIVCCMYAIAPFINPDDINKAFDLYNKHRPEGFISCSTEFTFPFQRGFYYENNNIELINPEHYWTRSQDLKKTYHETGTFWIGHRDAYVDEKPFISSESKPYFIESWRVQDIDYPDDWVRAELMYKALKNS